MNVASSTPVQPPGTLFHQTFTTLLIRVHSENDSRMYFLIVLTTDYCWRSWTSRIAAPYKSRVDWLIEWYADRRRHTLIARRSSSLQSSVNTVHPGLLRRNAWAAGSSFSIAHRDSAIPDWWKPSDRPQQPITNSQVTKHTDHCKHGQQQLTLQLQSMSQREGVMGGGDRCHSDGGFLPYIFGKMTSWCSWNIQVDVSTLVISVLWPWPWRAKVIPRLIR